ncbi:hypothetical protein D3C76_1124810 [compost metagenome]
MTGEVETDDHARAQAVLAQGLNAPNQPGGFYRYLPGRQAMSGDRCKVSRYQRLQLRQGNVAGHCQRRVVGVVPGPVPRACCGRCHVAEVSLVADRGRAIAAVVIGQQQVMFQGLRPRVVIDVLASFSHDNRQFAGKRCIAEGGAGHDIGHGFQGDLQAAGWQRERKGRGVREGECVCLTTQVGHEG